MNEFLRRLRDLMEQMHKLNYTARRRTTTLNSFLNVNSAESIFPNISTMNVDEFVRKFGIDEANQEEITGRIAPIIATAEAQSRNFRSNVMDAVTRGMADAARKGLEGDYRAYAREALRPAIKELHHIEAEVNTAGAALDRAGSIESARMAGIEWFRYVGPATNPRKFCAFHVGNIYHISEIEAMNNGQGLSVLYYMGGYHCRHQWVAVDEETVAKERPRQPRLFNKSDIKPADPRQPVPPPVVRERDDVTAKHWNGRRGKIVASDEAKKFIKTKLKGTAMQGATMRDIMNLTGAPDGATFMVTTSGDRLNIKIRHPWYAFFERTLIVNKDKKLQLHMDYMVLHSSKIPPDDGDGVIAPIQSAGLRTFASSVFAARAAGVSVIDTQAAGSARNNYFNGYYTWFRYGYNCDIDDNVRYSIDDYLHRYRNTLSDATKGKFKAAESILDLFDIGEVGRNFWKKYGRTQYPTFDTAENSRNSKVLQKYLDSKGIKI